MEKNQEVRRPKNNEIYRHFKGNLYKIITLAKDSETQEEMVVYQALYGDYPIHVRSLAMFTQVLDRTQYPDADQKYRFEPADQLINMERMEREILPRQEREAVPPSGEKISQGDVPKLDPLLEQFLDADSYRERLNILRGLEHRITHEMINTMAVVLDLEIGEGDLEKRCRDLENSIIMRERYECTRLINR